MFVSMVTVSKHTLVGNTSVYQNTPLATEMKQCYIVYNHFISFFLYAIYNTLTEEQFIKKKNSESLLSLIQCATEFPLHGSNLLLFVLTFNAKWSKNLF